MAEILAFNKWSAEGIVIDDPGLRDYICIKPRIVPKSGARYAGKRFHKSKVFIVERLINRLMVTGHKAKKHKTSSGHFTGKSTENYDTVKKAFEIIEKETKENPLKVFVKAIENAAPREELIAIEYGGARYPKAVECAPQRRVDNVIKLMSQGAFQRSFSKKTSIQRTLANEILAAYYLSSESAAVSKKLELERQADASR